MGKFIDLTGKQFGHLAVIEQAENKNGRVMWLCKCDCGVVKPIASGNLIKGISKSCGCGQRHYGKNNNSYKHGKSKTKLYAVWKTMRQRCNNPVNSDYKWYGAEGKMICEEWNDYAKFEEWAMLSGYKEGLTIDRIDSTGSYSPDNCRWITIQEQQQNKRNVRRFEYKGETHTLTELANIYNVPKPLLRNRIDLGWDIAEAIETPKMQTGHKIHKKNWRKAV
jgi:hypothetical protein